MMVISININTKPKQTLTNLNKPKHTLQNFYLLTLQIKLVNINVGDIVDGKPAIVLGLIWTIILYFQVIVLIK